MPETKHKSRLTPVRFLYRKPNKPDKNGYKTGYAVYWEYKCACGKVVTKNKKNVYDGFKGKWRGTKSCGCLKEEQNKKNIYNMQTRFKKGHKINLGRTYPKGVLGQGNKGKIFLFKNNCNRKDRNGGRFVTPEELEEIWSSADAV